MSCSTGISIITFASSAFDARRRPTRFAADGGRRHNEPPRLKPISKIAMTVVPTLDRRRKMSSAQQLGVFTRRHLIIVVVLVSSGFALAVAQPPSAAPPQGASSTASLASLKQDLVIADRILFDEKFLDTAGHVSVRLAPDRFLM